jgi:hypothetical protein
MDERCATCRWWGASDVTLRPPRVGWKVCDLTRFSDDRPEHPETTAFAVDIGRDLAELQTASDFGCVQWQSKE